MTDTDNLVGMSYVHVDEAQGEIEVGGLMVATRMRGKGLGDVLMRLPLAHLLYSEQPLRWEPQPRIVAHTLEANTMPRKIIGNAGFEHFQDVKIHGDCLPGLRTENDGNVHGKEFQLKIPDALTSLVTWLNAWQGTLRDGTPAGIQLQQGENIGDWAKAIETMP